MQEVTLSDLGAVLYGRRLLILALASLGAVAAASASFLFKPTYSAEVLLSPVSQTESASASSSLSSQFAGLASLAGVSLPGAGSAQQEAVATLEARIMTDAFIQDHDLLPVFFKSAWDSQRGAWKSTEPERIPTLWDGSTYFSHSVRTVTTDKKTGLVTLSIRWTDPVIAAQWANELVARTNTLLRDKTISRASKDLEFLQQQVEKTSIVEVRQAIYRLMENEIKTLTLAEGANEYALKVIDPATVPHRRTFPNRWLFLFGGGVLGGMIGIAYALFAQPVDHA